MNFAHPAFGPYRHEVAALALDSGFPGLFTLNALSEARDLVNACNLPLRFTMPNKLLTARAYEQQILQTGCVPTRTDNWHDIMNALAWLRFPRFKAALNAMHGEAMANETGALRERRRDALTMLDESGVWVISEDASLTKALRQREWHALFWSQRAVVIANMQFVVVGHALLEKMLQPYPAITGKCLLLHTGSLSLESAENQASLALRKIITPDQLTPLPLLGVPGWDPHNAHADYYANRTVFRQRRQTG